MKSSPYILMRGRYENSLGIIHYYIHRGQCSVDTEQLQYKTFRVEAVQYCTVVIWECEHEVQKIFQKSESAAMRYNKLSFGGGTLYQCGNNCMQLKPGSILMTFICNQQAHFSILVWRQLADICLRPLYKCIYSPQFSLIWHNKINMVGY